jgi:hypothetical protein
MTRQPAPQAPVYGSDRPVPSRHRRLLEGGRRLALLLGCLGAIGLAFLTRFEPVLMVSLAAPDDIARAQHPPEAGTRPSGALLSHRPVRKGDPEFLKVEGPQWEAFLADVARTFADNYPILGWEHRLSARDLAEARKDNLRRRQMSPAARTDEAERVRRLQAQYGVDVTFRGSFRQLYFRAAEMPFASSGEAWPPGKTLLPVRAGSAEPRLRVVALPAYRLQGFFDVITLPDAFAYPYRSQWWLPALLGLAIYLLLPWGRVPAHVVAYRRWRVILGDLVSLLLVVSGAALPVAILGGTVEAFTRFLPFSLAFSPFVALGLVGMYWATWTAVYRLAVRAEGLEVQSLAGAVAIPYADIVAVQPVRLRAPKWLIGLSWLAAMLGRSPGQAGGQMGRALLLGASAANGLELSLASGARHYVWYSDQLGGTSVQHFERLGAALRRESIRWGEQPREIRALFPPTR